MIMNNVTKYQQINQKILKIHKKTIIVINNNTILGKLYSYTIDREKRANITQ